MFLYFFSVYLMATQGYNYICRQALNFFNFSCGVPWLIKNKNSNIAIIYFTWCADQNFNKYSYYTFDNLTAIFYYKIHSEDPVTLYWFVFSAKPKPCYCITRLLCSFLFSTSCVTDKCTVTVWKREKNKGIGSCKKFRYSITLTISNSLEQLHTNDLRHLTWTIK